MCRCVEELQSVNQHDEYMNWNLEHHNIILLEPFSFGGTSPTTKGIHPISVLFSVPCFCLYELPAIKELRKHHGCILLKPSVGREMGLGFLMKSLHLSSCYCVFRNYRL